MIDLISKYLDHSYGYLNIVLNLTGSGERIRSLKHINSQQSQETGESYKKIPCPLIITLNLGEYTPNTCSPDTLVQFKLSTVLTLNSITCFYCKFEEVMKKKKWQRKLIKLYTLKMVEIPPTSKCLIKFINFPTAFL